MKRKLSAAILFLVTAILALVVSLERNHQARYRYQKPHLDSSYPNLHQQSVNIDEAFEIINNRLLQERQSVSGLNLSVTEKIKRIDAVESAGEDMTRQLQQSHYKEPFDKEAFEEDIQQRIAAK